MTHPQKIQRICAKWFWTIVGMHVILWTIVFTCIRHALSYNAVEATTWGQHLQWGYDKNPWVNAWLARLGILGGSSGWLVYLICELLVLLSFWAVWRLGKKIFAPVYALIAALLLEATVNYIFAPAFFNDNLIVLALWPLLFLCFYNALQKQHIRCWLGVGVFAGLALMTKYNTVLVFIPMFIFLLINAKARKSFTHLGIYLSLLVFILVCLPHVVWLVQHNFITIKYLLFRSGRNSGYFLNHIIYPLKFAVKQIINFIIPILLFLLLLFWGKAKKGEELAQPKVINKFDKYFLLTLVIGPFLLTLLPAIIFGWLLHPEWGVPLISLWGLFLFVCKQPTITKAAFYRFIIIILILLFVWPIGYIVSITHTMHKHSDNYPAPEIAAAVTQQWHERFHKPLKYVAGSRYIGGYVAFYSKDKPSVYVEWDRRFSSWIDLKKLKKYGAVFIQDGYYGTTVFGQPQATDGGRKFPLEVLKRFPKLQIQPLQYFPWYRGKGLKPVAVLIGFLPPADNHDKK